MKLWKAWDETSREGRRWVDVLVHAAVNHNHKFYILLRTETFDVRGLVVRSYISYGDTGVRQVLFFEREA